MRVHTLVSFDHAERQVLAQAFLHLRIAYPDAPEKKNDRGRNAADWRAHDVRSTAIAAKGDKLPRDRLEAAERALTKLAEVCAEQADPDYWQRHLTPSEGDPAPPSGGVGLIAPGTDVGGMLAETRAAQRDDAERALEVVRRALEVVPPDPEVDDD